MMIACLSPRCPFLLLLIGPNRSFLTRNWWSLSWPHCDALSHCLLLIPQQIKFDKKLIFTTLTTLRCPFALLVIDTSIDQIWQEIDNYYPDHTSVTNFEEILSTLKYAHTTKSVNNRPVMNIDQDPKDKMIRWQNIIQLLVWSVTRALKSQNCMDP